ncbi:MAG TPA: hypothetical protein VF189_06120 [Patescibacteria group bacterium]
MSWGEKGRQFGKSLGDTGRDVGNKGLQLGRKVGSKIDELLAPKVPAVPIGPQDVPTAKEVEKADARHKTTRRWKRWTVRPAFWGTLLAEGGNTLFTHQFDPRILGVGGGIYLLSALTRGIAHKRAENAEEAALELAHTQPNSELSRELFSSPYARRTENRLVKTTGRIGIFIGIVTALPALLIAPGVYTLNKFRQHGQHEHRKNASHLAKKTLKDFDPKS